MRRSRLQERKLGKKVNTTKNKKRLPIKLIVFVSFVLLIILLALALFLPRTWDGKSKISVAIQKESGEVSVIILDPASSSIDSINIPAETEIQAATQLGTWKLAAISRLGVDKKLGGSFLKNTIIKAFDFPIDYWASSDFTDLISDNMTKSVNSILSTNSDLTFSDKIRIALFAVGIGNTGRQDVNLKNSNYLERAQLIDGSLGWQVTGDTPTSIKSYFISSNPNLNLNVLLNNASSGNETRNIFAKTIDTLGFSVASTQELDEKNIDCKVTGTNKEAVQKIAYIFSCEMAFTKPANNFDIQVDFGTKTRNRF